MNQNNHLKKEERIYLSYNPMEITSGKQQTAEEGELHSKILEESAEARLLLTKSSVQRENTESMSTGSPNQIVYGQMTWYHQ